jgi:acetyl-CoA acetyltransferase family protein
MTDALILDALRTPIGRMNGGLSHRRSDDLAGDVLSALAKRNGLKEVDDVVLGCVTQTSEQGFNVARNAALCAGFPPTIPGTSVNRLCASGLQAIAFAGQAVASGQMDVVLAGGTENMSRVPMGSDGGPFSPRILERFELIPQGLSAEFIAEKWGFSRQQIDEFSYQSHQKALAADMAKEILPVDGISKDEGPRRDTSLEKMATLKPAFKEGGRLTAGNSSQISDGAAAVVVASPAKAKALGAKPRAKIVAVAATGVDPTIMLTGPISATQNVLKRAGMKLSDIDLFECNEAFAPVVLAWLKEMGADPARTNVNGGAVALGHPLGCSGARLAVTLLHELEKRNLKTGLVTLCIGMGQGLAMILQRT